MAPPRTDVKKTLTTLKYHASLLSPSFLRYALLGAFPGFLSITNSAQIVSNLEYEIMREINCIFSTVLNLVSLHAVLKGFGTENNTSLLIDSCNQYVILTSVINFQLLYTLSVYHRHFISFANRAMIIGMSMDFSSASAYDLREIKRKMLALR